MVENRQRRNEFDNAIATGRDNAAIRADVEGWCGHLNVEMLGVSPLGHAVGVPIGPHRLSCKHATYSTESVVLRSLFHGFLVDNCARCPHHHPGRRPELGHAFLTAAQDRDAQAREAERKRQLQIETLREELIALADERAATSHVEAASVFRLAADLFGETETNGTQMLCEAANVAPDLFEDKVLTLFNLGVSDHVFAAKCLPVLACLARSNNSLRDRIRPSVLESSELDLPIDLIAESVDACLSDAGNEVTDQLIDKLVSSQNYQRPIGGWPDEKEPAFTKTIALLATLIDLIPKRVAAVIDERLKLNHKWSRANTCRVIQELSKLRPEFGLERLPQLVRSLELDDDVYEGVSADGSAVDAVSELLVLRWSTSEAILRREEGALSGEAQAVLVGAYEKLFLRGDHWRDATIDGLDETIVTGAVLRCLGLLNDATQEPCVRRAAAEAIHTACRAGALLALNALDQLLGCLAIIVDSKPPAARPTIILPGREELQQQEQMLTQTDREIEWTRLKQELTEVIEEIGKRRPLEAGNALLTTLDAATSAGCKSLKLAALKLLGSIASHESELSVAALPSLMVCLMDYSSPSVRAVAIEAVTDAFRHSDFTVPSNVVDIIVLHLRDKYVAVHKSAVTAFRFWRVPLTELQRREAFVALYHIWSTYAQLPQEMFFMDDICDALLSVAYDNLGLRNRVLSLVCEYLPAGEVLVDSKLCEQLIRNADADAAITVKVAKALIKCLSVHHRDQYRHGRGWREDAAEWLSTVSTRVWNQVSNEFNACAQHVLRRDPGEAHLFAAVLCERGEHAEEAQALATAAESASGHSLFHGLHELLLRLHSRAVAVRGAAGK